MKNLNWKMMPRLALGFVFLLFGLNGLMQFLPLPAPSAEGGALLGAIGASGYMFPMVKITEIGAAILLCLDRYVNLALVLLAPIVVNVFAFHFFLDQAGLPIALLVLALWTWMVWERKENYSILLDK